jgi:hypothetical protein
MLLVQLKNEPKDQKASSEAQDDYNFPMEACALTNKAKNLKR